MFSICYNNSHIKSWRNKKNFEKLTKIKRFLNKYNWEGINFPSEKDDWKKFEKNNPTILSIFSMLKKYISCLCCKT